MTTLSLREQVVAVLRDEVKWEGPLPEGGLDRHLDSMQRLALVVALEDRFEICFTPEDEQGIHDLDDVVRCIAGKLEARA